MAKLNIRGENVCKFGNLIRSVAKDDAKLVEFIKNPKEHINHLHEGGKVPDNVQISVVVDTENLTYVMVPWDGDMKVTEEELKNGEYSFPVRYCDGTHNPKDSDSTKAQHAYDFRVGDYVLGRCV